MTSQPSVSASRADLQARARAIASTTIQRYRVALYELERYSAMGVPIDLADRAVRLGLSAETVAQQRESA